MTYTFTVEGGSDPADGDGANYHPFYITEDSEGGYAQKSAAEKARERVWAGVDDAGNPTAGKPRRAHAKL